MGFYFPDKSAYDSGHAYFNGTIIEQEFEKRTQVWSKSYCPLKNVVYLEEKKILYILLHYPVMLSHCSSAPVKTDQAVRIQ